MPLTAIALGSNLGDRDTNLRAAVKQLGVLGTIQRVSRFRETEPVGYVDQPAFLNGVALLETELRPADLMQALLNIEQIMGRDRSVVPAKGPRLIDLDIALYGDEKVAATNLTIPHPEMHRRRFVLEPLAEVAPRWVHPHQQRTVLELLKHLPEKL